MFLLKTQLRQSKEYPRVSVVCLNAYKNNEMFSPTLQTVIVISLLDMQGVENRATVLEKANWVDSEEMAFFFTGTVRMLSDFHNNQATLNSLIGDRTIMGGFTNNKRQIYALPIDHLLWSQEFAESFTNEKKQNELKNEFWLQGTATARVVG